MGVMIEILIKCKCMIREVRIDVPNRRQNEDVTMWMQNVVIPEVSRAHQYLSPFCKSKTMEYIKIQIGDNAEGIGIS